MFGTDIGLAHAFQSADDARDHLIDTFGINGAFLHGDADRAFQLVSVEILALTGGFDHHKIAQLHPFVSGKAAPASRAEPSAPDRDVILGRAAVFHLGVDISAKRAAHGPSPSSSCLTCGARGPLVKTYRGAARFWVEKIFTARCCVQICVMDPTLCPRVDL